MNNDTLTILSLGWGVQSWTLAAMKALRGCSCPRCVDISVDFDVAIHGDTTFELAQTYAFAEQWTPWLEAHGVRVVTVTDPRATHIMKKSSTSEGTYTLMPVFTRNPDGSKGQLRRQCTSRWKIEPIQRWLTQELKARGIEKTPGIVQQVLGISLDEFQRMKPSPFAWIENRYPLVEMRMTRNDCLAWLAAHDLPSPGKSACAQCPYHSQPAWRELSGDDWHNAVAADEALRMSGRQWFLHPLRIPLVEAVQDGQTALFDDETDPSCDSGHCFV